MRARKSAQDAVSGAAPRAATGERPVAATWASAGRARAEGRDRIERVIGPRVARKIFLGYILPLAFLLSFGIVLPIFMWFYLGRAAHMLEDIAWIQDHAISLKRNAVDTEGHAATFVQYHNHSFEEEFVDARDAYRTRYREIYGFIDANLDDPELTDAITDVGDSFQTWLRLAVNIPLDDAIHKRSTELPPEVVESQIRGIQQQFGPVAAHIDHFIALMERRRIRQERRAHAAELMRECTSVFIPLVVLVLSLLIGRSTALSITRPLEALTKASRELEQGGGAMRMLAEDYAASAGDDEIGDLQRSFNQMARTIGQREAVLRAQNEAVGALNRRIEAVLNATNDGILMLDRVGGFSVVNQRLADLFGVEMDSLLDHTFNHAGPLLLSRFKNKAAIRRRLQELIDDPESIADETHDLAEPHGRTVRIYSAPVRGNRRYVADASPNDPENAADSASELLGRIFVFRDVTRETMLDRMKTEFVSTVSHELRTPLTAIRGYVDLMVTGQTGALNDVQTEFLTLVQSSTQRLTSLINDMLDISRIESGRMELRQDSVNYVPLVQQTVRMMQQEADIRGVTLQVQVADHRRGERGSATRDIPAVRGDSDRITQVLMNFLSNGVKYTPQGGAVTISVEFEDDFVTTCIADTGIGISAEDQRRLFQKFFRADNSTTREAGGTGLGLAITKAILEKLNGSVWVESERGVGSKFFFTLPCVEADLVERPDSNTGGHTTRDLPPGEPGTASLVLPVSGDLPTLHRLGHELRRLHFVTSSAGTSAEALRRVRDLHPDFVLLDPLSPGIDGFNLLSEIALLPLRESQPILLLASLHLQSNNIAAFRDDLALLGSSGATDGEYADLMRVAFKAADTRSGASATADGAGGHVLLAIGPPAFGRRIEAALANTGLRAHLTVSRSREQLEPYLQSGGGGQHAPDLVIVAADPGFGFDRGEFMSRLRRRRPGEWVGCILLMEDAVLDALDIRTLAPLGSGCPPVEQIGNLLRAAMRQPRPMLHPVLGLESLQRSELRGVENATV